MQSVSTQSAAKAAPEKTPTRWLCRLGPWKMEFDLDQIPEMLDWAQEKTQYYTPLTEEHKNVMAWRIIRQCNGMRPWSFDCFGRTMKIDPLPLKPPRAPLKLPRFYPVLDKQRWTDVEVSPIVEDSNGDASDCVWEQTPDYWSVFVRLEYGGRDCVADMPTERQAQDLAAVIQSAATWFVPAK